MLHGSLDKRKVSLLKMENVTDSITTTNNGKRKWKIIIDRQMWSQQRHGSQHAVTNGKRGVVGPVEEGDYWDLSLVILADTEGPCIMRIFGNCKSHVLQHSTKLYVVIFSM